MMIPPRASGMKDPTHCRSISTSGAILDSRSVIELLAPAPGTSGLRLLHWNGENAEVKNSIVHKRTRYIPARYVRAVHFPSGVAEFESTEKLFDDLLAVLSRQPCLSSEGAQLATYFAMSTWLSDRLPIMPWLWITTPLVVSIEPFLAILTRLCRRALQINDFTVGSLLSLPPNLQPTLISEIRVTTSQLARAISASSKPGRHELSRGELRELACSKIFYSDRAFDPSISQKCSF